MKVTPARSRYNACIALLNTYGFDVTCAIQESEGSLDLTMPMWKATQGNVVIEGFTPADLVALAAVQEFDAQNDGASHPDRYQALLNAAFHC